MSANRKADNTSAFLMQNTKDRMNGQTFKKRMRPFCCGNEAAIMFPDYKLAVWNGKNHRSFFQILYQCRQFWLCFFSFSFFLPVGVLAKKNVKIYVSGLLLYIALSNRAGENKGKHFIVHSQAD